MIEVVASSPNVFDPIIHKAMRAIGRDAPRIAAGAARRVAKKIKDDAVQNLSGRVWNGGPYAVKRFHTTVSRGSGMILGTAASVEAEIVCWTTDPVSAIMEFGVSHPWEIMGRARSQGWKSRRKYRDTRGKTRLGAFVLSIKGRLVMKVTRRGLKRRPWLGNAIASVSRRDIEEAFYDTLWHYHGPKDTGEV